MMKINANQEARKIDVDDRIPLDYYYRIAENLLHQASIYREENDVVNLYIILLRFSSLVCETIPFHRDYKSFPPKKREHYRKRLLSVLDELEFLKPKYQRKLDELNQKNASQTFSNTNATPYSAWRYNASSIDVHSPNLSQISKPSNNLSISLPHPKQETLLRHSFLGPSGLHSQWVAPSVDLKVQYPSSTGLIPPEQPSFRMNELKKENPAELGSLMESVLSLDDGGWRRNEVIEDPFQFSGVHQPSPPPVLARVHHEFAPIPPSKVADPRPGSGNPHGSSNSFQHVHVPVNLMDEFLRLARANTTRNLETCGVLAGILKNRVFHISTLIVPKQESTSDSCSTLNEEEIFDVQDKLSLFPLGWIHTHPTQTCFMSSVDLHTHYSYQIMLPESIAIVMAPTDESSPHGIFHLSDPSGVSVIRNCEQRGFHPHEETPDGSPIYEHCSHVYLNAKMKYQLIDLR